MQHSKQHILTTKHTKDTKVSDSVFFYFALFACFVVIPLVCSLASKAYRNTLYNYNLLFASLALFAVKFFITFVNFASFVVNFF